MKQTCGDKKSQFAQTGLVPNNFQVMPAIYKTKNVLNAFVRFCLVKWDKKIKFILSL